jgi:hypothetical protein
MKRKGNGRSEVSSKAGRIPPPLFFVNVASKGFSCDVSLLFATFARKPVNVAAKGFREEEVRT